jgi:opacity protein-like surface antigen
MKLLRVSLALVFVSLLTRAARADDAAVDFGRPGFYLGVGASRSVNLIEAFLDGQAVLDEIQVSDAWGVNARAGYRLTSWLALEGEYEWLNDFHAELAGQRIGSLGLQSATANLKFILPVRRFQPYFLIGAGALFSSVDTGFHELEVEPHAFAGRIGIGFDVYLTQNLILNSGVEGVLSPAKITLNLGPQSFSQSGLGTLTFQLGLGYRF